MCRKRACCLQGDIASNILYGNPDADQQTMEEAASIAQATEFIQQTEKDIRPRFPRAVPMSRAARSNGSPFHVHWPSARRS